DHRHQLEGGTWLEHHTSGKIEFFMKAAPIVTTEIRYCFHFTGRHFHNDNKAVIGVMFRHGIVECSFGNILQVDIQSSLKVKSIHRLHVGGIKNWLPYTPSDFLIVCIAVLASEVFVEAVFEAGAFFIFIHETNRPAAQM